MYAAKGMNGLRLAAETSGPRVLSLMVVGILSALPAGWMHAHSIAAALSHASACRHVREKDFAGNQSDSVATGVRDTEKPDARAARRGSR
jgi:hypothetical protein